VCSRMGGGVSCTHTRHRLLTLVPRAQDECTGADLSTVTPLPAVHRVQKERNFFSKELQVSAQSPPVVASSVEMSLSSSRMHVS
jgi:hypothetical protein